MEQKVVGQTARAGFQIGVRRALAISPEEAWDFLMSEPGLKCWLGTFSSIQIEPKFSFESKEGISGEFRIVKPFLQIRLTWKKKEWQKPSTLQIRFLSGEANKTTISFHQENLSDQQVREEMKLRWEDVLEKIRERHA
ncbi:MAG: ATPase [Brevibacillus sp.]|nr:ATPase [Brevibacillus sp.]